MDQDFIDIVTRNRKFFTTAIEMMRVQIKAGITTQEAITKVIDNRFIWTAEPTDEERTALIEFFKVVLEQKQNEPANN